MEREKVQLDSSALRARLRGPQRRESVYMRRGMAPMQAGSWLDVAAPTVAKQPPVAQQVEEPAVEQPVVPFMEVPVANYEPMTEPEPLNDFPNDEPLEIPHDTDAITLVKPAPITHTLPPKGQKSEVLWRSAVSRPERSVPQETETLLHRQFEPQHRQPLATQKPHKRSKKPLIIYAMAGVVFLAGAVVSLNGFLTNRSVTSQVKHLSASADGATTPSNSDKPTPPSTAKIAADAISKYAVAPNLPRYLDIGKLGVHARVLSMGVNASDHLQAPSNVYDAGWYNASAQPGQPGAMLIDGHVSSWTTQGVFYGLTKLVAGDTITVTRGDNQQFTYKVKKTQLYNVDAVDMASLLVSQDKAKPGLSLITCSGDVIPGTNEFDKRFVVYAVME